MKLSGTLSDLDPRIDPEQNITVAGTFLFLGRYATVFQTMVIAILGCAQRLEDLSIEGRHISICSDSQAALRALPVPAIGMHQASFLMGTGTHRYQRQ